ncbi:MAG: alginate O-acetyltransferase complex protein AlgI [Verrucomicrobiales bacterium]|jgi:alginate O-acetyltransferase complex protein AlgI
MLFQSLEYALFLPAVFFCYWSLARHSLAAQNLFLIGASYMFYAWWDWRFVSLIVLSSLVDFVAGLFLGKTKQGALRNVFLLASLATNLGILGVFKYFDFFAASLVNAFASIGIHLNAGSLSLVLPVGISFYTFQTLSYTIDVYRGRVAPCGDPVSFFAYVSFFPQLVAGPIERADSFLPQFQRKRTFRFFDARDGLRQILWGLFKKVVVADNCAVVVDEIFDKYTDLPGSILVLGAIFFAFQIYADFSGYSDIAIGTAKLFGFRLRRNFAYPYFSRDIGEFWRRWHISLSTWFRDYVYVPLGGNRRGSLMTVRNVMIVFMVSGLWHGANWTFVVWGALNGLLLLPRVMTASSRKFSNSSYGARQYPRFREFLKIAGTFLLTCLVWIFFRSESVIEATDYLGRIFSPSILVLPTRREFYETGAIIVALAAIEWFSREKLHPLEELPFKQHFRWIIYLILSLAVIINAENRDAFIYFQF